MPRWSDYLLIGLFALGLFGYAGFGGRPLTMHEARLPQTSREMLASGAWLLPTSGGRPWLERPPLPHWVVCGAMSITGRTDAVWVVRLPSAVLGTVAVLLTVWIAGQGFGRAVGQLSGVALATSLEFYQYATIAEDDVYLAALVTGAVALFVRSEMAAPAGRWRPFGSRAWAVWALFAVAGLSNWTRGPLLGLAYLGSALGAFLVWDAVVRRTAAGIGRFAWAWGLVLAAALTVAWPAYAYRHVPDVLANWRYDYGGRLSGAYSDINQPWWYYAAALPAALAPWTPATGVGLLATWRLARSTDGRAARLVWCWAIVPVLGLSIPHGKHHHYLVPTIPASAILSGVGLREAGRAVFRCRGPGWPRRPTLAVAAIGLPVSIVIVASHRRIPSPLLVTVGLAGAWVAFVAGVTVALRRADGRLLTAALAGGIAVGCCWAQTYAAAATDHTAADTAFLLRGRGEVPADAPLFVDAKLGPAGNLDFFRCQFYSRPDAVLLHNLTYLRLDTIAAPTVYVIARGNDRPKLDRLGTTAVVDRSPASHEAGGRFGNLTLFRLTFTPGLRRYPAPPRPTSLQAMERAESTDPGPFCGPPL